MSDSVSSVVKFLLELILRKSLLRNLVRTVNRRKKFVHQSYNLNLQSIVSQVYSNLPKCHNIIKLFLRDSLSILYENRFNLIDLI